MYSELRASARRRFAALCGVESCTQSPGLRWCLPMFLRSLKWLQLAVAIAMTAASVTGLLLPGVMSLLLAPFTLLYVVWAARSVRDHRVSIWLALASTVAVAILVGALGASMTKSTFGARPFSDRIVAPVIVDPAGGMTEPRLEVVPRFEQIQAQIERRERLHALVLLALGLTAWLVVGLYVVEWRWAFTGRVST